MFATVSFTCDLVAVDTKVNQVPSAGSTLSAVVSGKCAAQVVSLYKQSICLTRAMATTKVPVSKKPTTTKVSQSRLFALTKNSTGVQLVWRRNGASQLIVLKVELLKLVEVAKDCPIDFACKFVVSHEEAL